MRWIQKNSDPVELRKWRSRNSNDVNLSYELLRKDSDVIKAVTESLIREQGWLCAYTGLRIEGYSNSGEIIKCGCHIDHVKAQDHCSPSETVLYTNMVACYPGPNPKSETPYGGERKRNWPAPSEQHLFEMDPIDWTEIKES